MDGEAGASVLPVSIETIKSMNFPNKLSIALTAAALLVTLIVNKAGASENWEPAFDALPGWTVVTEKERAVFTRVDGIHLELPPGSERSGGWLRFDNVANAKSVAEELSSDGPI
jgi:hypothetical protein